METAGICAGGSKRLQVAQEPRGGWLEVDAPLETMPVFLRDGKSDDLVGMPANWNGREEENI